MVVVKIWVETLLLKEMFLEVAKRWVEISLLKKMLMEAVVHSVETLSINKKGVCTPFFRIWDIYFLYLQGTKTCGSFPNHFRVFYYTKILQGTKTSNSIRKLYHESGKKSITTDNLSVNIWIKFLFWYNITKKYQAIKKGK